MKNRQSDVIFRTMIVPALFKICYIQRAFKIVPQFSLKFRGLHSINRTFPMDEFCGSEFWVIRVTIVLK